MKKETLRLRKIQTTPFILVVVLLLITSLANSQNISEIEEQINFRLTNSSVNSSNSGIESLEYTKQSGGRLTSNSILQTHSTRGIQLKSQNNCSKCYPPFWGCEKGECVRQSVFSFNQLEIFGIFITIIIIAIMTAVNVGTEVLLIPVIKIFFYLNSIHAVALSQICTAVSSLIKLLMICKHKNPHKETAVIDYNIASIFLPSMFIGSNLGLVVTYFLPNFAGSTILLLTLLATVYRIFLNGLNLLDQSMTKKPNMEYTDMADCNRSHNSDEDLSFSVGEESEYEMTELANSDFCHRVNKEKLNISLSTIQESGSSGDGDFDLSPGGTLLQNENEYFLCNKFKLVLVTIVRLIFALVCLGSKDIMNWSKKTKEALMFYGALSGMLSTLTGMGGEIIFIPLLLSLGVRQNVSIATATLFGFFSSLSNAVLAVLFDEVYYDFAIWLLLWTNIGTLLGLFGLKNLIERISQTSTVIFMIVILLCIAICTIMVDDVVEIWKELTKLYAII
ncbi:unnamed protein product [Moneuplotes crassus]|uniref:Uncharacterized protein n=1 Tax=Euplotes crassus TaxID=5936 RepID=A0AAD1XDG4_EUPCR|nr:unnamed protein product [Moneuplotes crassus]